jgi:hypothetical protein
LLRGREFRSFRNNKLTVTDWRIGLLQVLLGQENSFKWNDNPIYPFYKKKTASK